MVTNRLAVVAIVLGLIQGGWTAFGQEPAAGKPVSKLRVGVFDSRAVAVAYTRSASFNKYLGKLMEEHKQAKAAGDAEKVRRYEAQGKALQAKLHLQGFGTASVAEILEEIKAEIPGIAKEVGVDLIVSKWDVVFQLPNTELIDITDQIVKPFHPDGKTLSIIKQLRDQKPLPHSAIEQHKH